MALCFIEKRRKKYGDFYVISFPILISHSHEGDFYHYVAIYEKVRWAQSKIYIYRIVCQIFNKDCVAWRCVFILVWKHRQNLPVWTRWFWYQFLEKKIVSKFYYLIDFSLVVVLSPFSLQLSSFFVIFCVMFICLGHS